MERHQFTRLTTTLVALLTISVGIGVATETPLVIFQPVVTSYSFYDCVENTSFVWEDQLLAPPAPNPSKKNDMEISKINPNTNQIDTWGEIEFSEISEDRTLWRLACNYEGDIFAASMVSNNPLNPVAPLLRVFDLDNQNPLLWEVNLQAGFDQNVRAPFNKVDVSSDGSTIVVATMRHVAGQDEWGTTIRRFNLANGNATLLFEEEDWYPVQIELSGDGEYILFVSLDAYNLTAALGSQEGLGMKVTVCESEDGEVLWTSDEFRFHRNEMPELSPFGITPSKVFGFGAEISGDGSRVSIFAKEFAGIYETASGDLIWSTDDNYYTASSLSFNGSHFILCNASWATSVGVSYLIWDAINSEYDQEWRWEANFVDSEFDGITYASIASADQFIAIGGYKYRWPGRIPESRVGLWQSADADPKWIERELDSFVNSMSISGSGNFIAASSTISDVEPPKCLLASSSVGESEITLGLEVEAFGAQGLVSQSSRFVFLAQDNNPGGKLEVHRIFAHGNITVPEVWFGDLYIGDCDIADGGVVRIFGEFVPCRVHLLDDFEIKNGGGLQLLCGSEMPRTNHIYLNGNDLEVEAGGYLYLEFFENEVIKFHGSGSLDLQDLRFSGGVIGGGAVYFVANSTGSMRVDFHNDIVISNEGWLFFAWEGGPPHEGILDVYMHGNDINIQGGGHLVVYDEGAWGGRVRIHDLGEIRNAGELRIEGTAAARMELTSSNPLPNPGDITGIVVEDITSSCLLKYLDIKYATNAITAEDCGSYLTLDHVNITNFSSTGINLINSDPTISYCSASGSPTNGSYTPIGLYVYNSKPKVTHSTFDENAKGITVTGSSSSLKLGYSSVSNNEGAGITFFGGSGYLYNSSYYTDLGYNHIIGNGADAGVYKAGTSYPYLSSGSAQGKNSIYGNTSYEIKNSTTVQISAENNWWNDILGPSAIYGSVDYNPWLMSSPGGGPAPRRPDDKDEGGKSIADALDVAFYNADDIFAEGEFTDAIQAYERIISSNPGDQRVSKAFGQIHSALIELGREDEWSERITAIVNNDRIGVRGRLNARRMLADAELHAGNGGAARDHLDGALRGMQNDDEDRPYIRFDLGMLQHYGQDQLESAIGTFEGLIEDYPDHPIHDLAILELAECNREAHEIDSPTEPKTGKPVTPEKFELLGCYPNPFNSVVQIKYAIPEQTNVKVTIHDASGREIATLFDDNEQAGIRNQTWTATNTPAGLYFCKVVAGSQTATMKVMLVK